MDKLIERYRNDPVFHALVAQLWGLVLVHSAERTTVEDLASAVVMVGALEADRIRKERR